MRVATKYVNLTRRFFAKHGVADYRIVESLGATEGAPAAGAAELIVDITTIRRDAGGQCAEAAGRRDHPAFAGDAGRLDVGALGAGGARERQSHPRPHRRERRGAPHP